MRPMPAPRDAGRDEPVKVDLPFEDFVKGVLAAGPHKDTDEDTDEDE